MMIMEKRIPVFFKNMYQTSPIFQLEAFISREIGIFGNIFFSDATKTKKRAMLSGLKMRKIWDFFFV